MEYESDQQEKEQQTTISDIENQEDNIKPQSSFTVFFVIVGIFLLIGIILLSIKVFGPASTDDIIKDIIENGETEDGYLYNGFVFIYQGNLWHTRWQVGDVMLNLHFHYDPRSVEDIPLIGSLQNNTDISRFYLTFDPLEENMSLIALASSELGLNLVKGMNVKLTPACISNLTKNNETNNACASRPIINCNNTDESVILIKTADVSSVNLKDNCITIQGPGNDLLKSVDKFLYRSYKIIPKTG
jgi:hypothetical protein